ncbi:hypothetical protein AALB53_21185 [Lachnospiraceae bacterium 47-T17]
MEFAEQIMVDLIKQEYSSDDLRDHFKEEVSHVRLAMEAMLAEAVKIASSGSKYVSCRNAF